MQSFAHRRGPAAEQSPRPRSASPTWTRRGRREDRDGLLVPPRRISETDRATDQRQRRGHGRASTQGGVHAGAPVQADTRVPAEARRSGRGGRRHRTAAPVPPSRGSGDGPAPPPNHVPPARPLRGAAAALAGSRQNRSPGHRRRRRAGRTRLHAPRLPAARAQRGPGRPRPLRGSALARQPRSARGSARRKRGGARAEPEPRGCF